MKNHSIKIVIVILVISLPLASALLASDNQITPLSIKTKLSFFGDQELKSRVTSYLNRELRSLGDVTLVEDNFNYLAGIWAYTTGHGVAISYTVAESFDNKPLNNLFELSCRKADEHGKKLFKKFAKELTDALDLRDFGLIVGPIKDLKVLCQIIIKKMDMRVFESARKMHRVRQKVHPKRNK